jgi:hypothetical protein
MCCCSFCWLLVQVGRRKEGRWDKVELFGTQGTSVCSIIWEVASWHQVLLWWFVLFAL